MSVWAVRRAPRAISFRGRETLGAELNMTDQAQLSDLVYEGLIRAKESFRMGAVDRELAGVALCTDDELGTLYCMMIDTQEVEGSDDPDLLFTPVDWPCGDELEPFLEANKMMRERLGRSGDLLPHVDRTFEALVEALSRFRERAEVLSSAFLSVLSTDPSDYLLELEGQSVERLNEKSIVVRRDDFLSRWA